MSDPALSVLIASTRPIQLKNCLRSLEGQDFKNFEVIVAWQADDTATRDAAELFQKSTPLVLTIVHAAERGIVPAENAALDRSRGEIISLLDDDAVAPPDWISRQLRHYAAAEVGAVGGPIANFHPGGVPFPSRAAQPPGKLTWYGRALSNMYDQPHAFRSRPPREVEQLPGGNMSLRRDAFDRFEAGLKPYWQGFELDACMQVKARSFKVLFDFSNVIDHYPTNTAYVGDRTGDLQIKVLNNAYNHAFILAKHSRGSALRFCRLTFLLLVGTPNIPGLAAAPIAMLRYRRAAPELALLAKTWRAHIEGWIAGSRHV